MDGKQNRKQKEENKKTIAQMIRNERITWKRETRRKDAKRSGCGNQ